MICPKCQEELLWGGDHSYEDYDIHDEDGIVSNYSCRNDDCDIDTVIAYTKFDHEIRE